MAKLTKEKVEEALTQTRGNMAAASRKLKVTRRAVQYHVGKHKDLQEIVFDAREGVVDDAETSLADAVKAGEAWAVCFTLKTQGRGRGYIEKHEVEHSGKVDIHHYNDLNESELAAEVERLARLRDSAGGVGGATGTA